MMKRNHKVLEQSTKTCNVQVIKIPSKADANIDELGLFNSRGRQAVKSSVKTTVETTSHFAAFNTKSMLTNKIPRNKKVSYYTRKVQYSVEEDYESSESEDYKKKRKDLYCAIENESQEGPFREDYGIMSNENSIGEEEKNDCPMDLELQYKEKLNNEIEKILIEIYNSHMTSKKRKLDNSSISQNLNEQWYAFILKILTEKIKELIKRYKCKIFEIQEFKLLRDTFLKTETLQQNIAHNNNNNNNNNSHENEIHFYQNLNLSLPLNLTDSSINKITKDLLLELRNIKNSLILSSSDIEEVFKHPLISLNRKTQSNTFHVEDIHREEYTKTLVQDEFISGFLSLVKPIAKHLQNEEVCELISSIEEDKHSTKREMTRLVEFLEENPQIFIETDNEIKSEEVNLDSEAITAIPKNVNSNSKQATAQIFTPTSASSEGSTLVKDINSFIVPTPAVDIDELVKFIENEENKPKKSKKKAKSGKKRKEKESVIDEIPNPNPLTASNDYDKEIEQFKQTIVEWSLSQPSRQKIKPQFTKEWLRNISMWQ